MNRALGMFESQSKLWRLASLAQSSGAPVTKWATRVVRDGQIHVWFHCVGIRVSDQLERLLWRSVPHIVVTSATAALAKQLLAPAGDERSEGRKRGPLRGAGFAVQPRGAGENYYSSNAL